MWQHSIRRFCFNPDGSGGVVSKDKDKRLGHALLQSNGDTGVVTDIGEMGVTILRDDGSTVKSTRSRLTMVNTIRRLVTRVNESRLRTSKNRSRGRLHSPSRERGRSTHTRSKGCKIDHPTQSSLDRYVGRGDDRRRHLPRQESETLDRRAGESSTGRLTLRENEDGPSRRRMEIVQSASSSGARAQVHQS